LTQNHIIFIAQPTAYKRGMQS